MLGIAVAYKGLNKKMANAGAAYEWTKTVFGGFFGYFSGWALLIAALVFMVTGSVPLGTATIDLFNPALASNVWLTTGIGAVWFVVIGVVLITGIELTSKIQVVMSSIELLILFGISIAAFLHTGTAGAVTHFSWSWFGLQLSRRHLRLISADRGVPVLGLGRHLQSERGNQGPSAQRRRQWRILEHLRHHRLLRGLHRRGADDVHAGRPPRAFRTI